MTEPGPIIGASPDQPDGDHTLVRHFGRLVELPAGERAAILNALEISPDRRKELERLLALDARTPAWLDTLAAQILPPALDDLRQGTSLPHELDDDHWEFLGTIGAGGMGVVHKARDRRLDRVVALKFLPFDHRRDPAARERLLAEARAASALDHPSIGVIHQLGVTGEGKGGAEGVRAGQPFIAMAFYEGATLAELAARGPVPLGTVLDWGTRIADGLGHAHRAGIVHRDLKPSNVIVTDDGRVKILDFGIAALRGERPGASGTWAYMSPGQLEGRPAIPEDDVWSLGVVLSELLSGDRTGDRPLQSLPAGLPEALVGLLGRCLDEDASRRPPDGGAVAAELRGIVRARTERAGREAGGAPPRVAVLPFANVGLSREDDWFSDGLTEEVLDRLARVDGLRVTGRASAMRLKGRLLPADQVARELEVRYLVEGGVRRAEGRIRVSIRLLDTDEDRYLWTDTVEGKDSEVFAIQERVAIGVVEALPVELTGPDRRALGRRPIEEVRAWESYLRARAEAWRFSAEALGRARRHLHAALEVVGPNALLYSTLGHLEAISVDAGVAGGPEALDRIDDFANRTVELDPESGRASWLRSFAALHRGDMARAVRAGEQAIEALPRDPDVLVTTGYILARVGQTKRASALFDTAIELDPLTPLNRCMPGFVALLEGRWRDALEPYRVMREMDPDAPFTITCHGWALAYADQVPEAIATLGEVTERFPGTVFASWAGSLAAGLAGDKEGALERISPEFESAARGSEMFARALTHCRALAGDAAGGLEALRKMVELGMLNLPFLQEHDRLAAELRVDPRFDAILVEARHRLKHVGRDWSPAG